jgi:hypothetical protein
MSEENVQLVMRCLDLFNRGEMEAMLRYVDPAIETTEGVEASGCDALCRPCRVGDGLEGRQGHQE